MTDVCQMTDKPLKKNPFENRNFFFPEKKNIFQRKKSEIICPSVIVSLFYDIYF